jgi:ubiquinone/menaquinone biosynthesis C-methylase UbiE
MPMLREQVRQRNAINGNWPLVQGDIHELPIKSHLVDVVIAGWVIGHFVGWYEQDWVSHINQALKEMHRTVKPGGVLIFIETLGTGSVKPEPPDEGLSKYYAHLENRWGLTRREISTDYQFDSIDDAIEKAEFFFGSELSEKIRANNWIRLPEWTGIWSKQI